MQQPDAFRLPVMETFESLQGEGFHTGIPSYFIRIGGCDVGCHWCDVKESWDPLRHPLREVDEVIKAIPPHIRTVVITGGEPLLYDLSYLTKRLKQNNLQIHLETSGTGPLRGEFDWICLSPKKNLLPLPELYAKADELKIIVFNKTDFDFAEKQAALVRADIPLFLQPEWSRREKMLPQIVDYILRNPRWRLSLQTHKYIGLP